MRYLAVDLGDKRTGLAVGDDESMLASPADVLHVRADPPDELLDAAARAVDEYAPDAIVVGLPLNMDGTEGPRAGLARAFAARLGARVGLPVHLHDERLTSADADWSMARSGLTRKQKKQRRDALAAAALLRDFLESLGAEEE